MIPGTVIGLNLVSTDALIHELCGRYEAIIIVREDRKDKCDFYVTAKTQMGKHANLEAGFDLYNATALLANAQLELVAKHFGLEKDEEEGTDDPPDTD